MNPIYKFEIKVTADMVDDNGHVNNVVYIQWMQNAAIRHAHATGCTRESLAAGGTWVVRTHQIEYLSPVFAGDTVTVLTWVSNILKVRSLRKYKFIRTEGQILAARAETNWVFVNARTGRPQAIADEIKNPLPVVSRKMEP
jgi:acyl-CoA thioester hydrolase